MLSASAYSFRQKSRLAISLSWVAGYTNVIAFLMCGGIVVSHVTGNVTHLGHGLAERAMGFSGAAREIGYFGYLVGMFLVGAIASAFLTEGARRRGERSKYILPMAVEALLLSLFSIGINLHYQGRITVARDFHFFWMSGVASLAMGLQNATITRISGAVVRTTHLTGVVTDLGLEGVQYLLWALDKMRGGKLGRRGRVLRVSQRHPTVLRIMLLASIFGSFMFGVVAGTIVFLRFPTYALAAPVLFLLWIIWVDWRKPIADVRELDLTADSEYGGYAAVKAILPPELGLWRLTHHRTDKLHHAPDFQAWVERLPRHWRVIILAVSPLTHFDADAVLDLNAAVQKLRQQRRDLIMCGVRPVQYKVLSKGGLIDVLGIENFCPDLDLAIARGMNLAMELTPGRAEEGAAA
jgi:uncharacterized membrane protein YoaK (UPF0700 family)/anti-anti-sigma regulatory factor